ncbi:response regulator transcription factor [Candidatus Nitrotoga arctica]|uniref:Chemotaxis protein CheY n=1 Tax=Candidatus Nitrotoga arctica TaxID=453162 RepID=A0ABM8YW31_9PROT|nr:response regulator [Candidatus Nitrotoga arctica]CAG9931690.1 Chemotaxis protein CheY [Candidatus Nitrotoga arctica]
MEKLKKLSVIVVDDDNMMREMLKYILRSEDYPVIGEASNGQDAIALCAKQKPGLVLLDINMPKMDGMQVLEGIRKISPATIVLMVSAEATMNKVHEAIEKGADGFVVKPLNSASVLDKIAMCIERKGSQ